MDRLAVSLQHSPGRCVFAAGCGTPRATACALSCPRTIGRTELSATQINTQVSIRKFKEVHALTHPAKIEKPATASPASAEAQASEQLLSSLVAEAADKDAPGSPHFTRCRSRTIFPA